MLNPKRKYTVTEKVLAANRANLLKANAVDKAIRYRPTPKRLAACHANLSKAHERRRAAGNPCPNYGATFRHGLHALSLRRSLELAGESPAEYDDHLATFDRLYAPSSEFERKLVRGLAGVVWRRLRVFHTRARWERRAIELRLAQAAAISPREFALLGRARRDLMLAGKLVAIFASDTPIFQALDRLNQRFERLARLLELERSPRTPPLEIFTHFGQRDLALAARPAASLANPFVSPRRFERDAKPSQQGLVEPAYWDWKGDARAPAPPFGEAFSAEDKALRFNLLRGVPENFSTPGPPDRENFLALFARALGEETRNSKTDSRPAAEAAWERLAFYRRQAEEESARVKEILDWAAGAAASRCPAGSRQLSERLLRILANDHEESIASLELEQRFQGALYEFMTARYGESERFAWLRPDPRLVPRVEYGEGTPRADELIASEAVAKPGKPRAP